MSCAAEGPAPDGGASTRGAEPFALGKPELLKGACPERAHSCWIQRVCPADRRCC